MSNPNPTRRTQKERREGTIRKLLDAATDSLIEDGYAGASVQRISARAGLSQGGLFRHFATREALMVAAAEDVGQTLLDGFERAFEKRKAREDPLRLALSLVRETCRSRPNQAWYELAIAARTSPALQKALAPIATRYYEKIEALGRALLPELDQALGKGFTAVIGTILAVFDGESIQRFIVEDRAIEDARFDVLLMLSRTLIAAGGDDATGPRHHRKKKK
jgi:AcrR family transcriptional regulator